jgi:serine/threonine protein kinase/Tfp pilus assembly protein PilF
MIGQQLAQFKITEMLGEGAMGAVYRAEDTRLGRHVAIKVLPEEFTADPIWLARFEREARVLASLNHPGIVTIYDLASAAQTEQSGRPPDDRTDNGTLHFLVMELIEGHTLDQEIREGGMPLERFFALVVPLAETLAAAHEHGVIHRDLKPGNIMVTPTDQLKVLDFGLAKRQASEAELDEEMAPKSMVQLTQEHQIIGTVPYMSPEQVRTEPVDQRSDLFSLGIILFEMITGERPFQGVTTVDLISSILREPIPDLNTLRPALPWQLVDLIRGCLAKSREARIQSALEVRDQLVAIKKPIQGGKETTAGSGIESRSGRSQEFDPRSIAVLPFEKLSQTDEAEFLASGLHNDLITDLSKVPSLKVISRTSVMGYQSTPKTPSQISQELGVGTIVEGAIQSAGNRVRLTVQLIEAATNVHRWAERYDRELSTETLFAIQSELARRIVDSLLSKLVVDQEIPTGKRRTEDLEAYRLVSLGRMQFDRRTEDGFRRAIEHFENAVERDPDYLMAWVGLADALALMEDYGYGDSEALLARAKKAVDRALALDPDSAEAHTSLGLYYSTLQDGPATMREWELAVQIQPGYAIAHNWMSWVGNLLGRASGALASAQRAVELDPLSAEVVSNLALSLVTNGEPGKALVEARRAEELSPGWTTAIFYEGLALCNLGRLEEAKTALSDLTVEWAGLGAEATLALTHVALGEEQEARQTLTGIDPGVDAFAAGLVHLALGEVDAAFDLFTSVELLTAWPSLAVHSLYKDVWETVKDDTRYQTLVRHAYTSWNLEPQEET